MKNKRDLKLIEFIEKNENWKELIQQKPYSIAVKEEDGFILLKYNQLESDFSNEVVRECRGIILGKNLKPVCIPFFKFGNIWRNKWLLLNIKILPM